MRLALTAKTWVLTVILFQLLALVALAETQQNVSPELRGVWITRFEWPDRNPETCKGKILRLMDKAARSGFNVVFFQVRGQADVLYPSSLEPWSPILGSRDPGFDPLQFALDAAHARGLEFHAYINAFPVWGGRSEPPHSEPEHLYWTHCQAGSPDFWLCCGEDGLPMSLSEYYYLSPGIPAVQDYVRTVVLDVVRRYDVDGIHLDRIRYPSPKTSHDPVSLARFNGYGNPDGLDWADWQRDQVGRMLNNLYGAILELKPQVKLTASVWGIYDRTRIPGYGRFSSGFHDYYQDSQRWAEMGVVDGLVPMIYWDMADPKPNYNELLDDFMRHAAVRHVYGGYHAKYENFDEIKNEILYTRQAGGQGTVAFASSYLDRQGHWKHFRESVYEATAETPAMAWKQQADSGAIVGRVFSQDGQPVVDARVNVLGSSYNWLSSADGFFACLHLPVGEYLVTAQRADLGKTSVEKVVVRPGAVTRIEAMLTGALNLPSSR